MDDLQLVGVTLVLTAEQRAQIQRFWNEHGSVGIAEIRVEVVNGCVSPASIQVGTAK